MKQKVKMVIILCVLTFGIALTFNQCAPPGAIGAIDTPDATEVAEAVSSGYYPVTLTLTASSATVPSTGTVILTASGGVPPYTFAVSPATLGTVKATINPYKFSFVAGNAAISGSVTAQDNTGVRSAPRRHQDSSAC